MSLTTIPADASDQLRKQFAHFAAVCADYCPLYAELSARVAEDEPIRLLAANGHKGHPPPNLLFGAVHYLLLKRDTHPLRDYFPSVGGTKPASEAYPVFHDFCLTHRDAILHLVATRLVQTNEVGRCGILLFAFHVAQTAFENHPLHLIEVGASSGLNLFFDQYHYQYSNGKQVGPANSPARIETELRGDSVPPIPDRIPTVANRIGIDLAPVDVMNDDAMLWLESLIWPDMVERLTLFRAARDIARQNPPTILKGDALNLLPEAFASVSDDALPCIFHCHAIYQMEKPWHEKFNALLADLGRKCDFAHLSQEWLGDDPGPMLRFEEYRIGNPEPKRTLLAEVHHHGRWLRWVSH